MIKRSQSWRSTSIEKVRFSTDLSCLLNWQTGIQDDLTWEPLKAAKAGNKNKRLLKSNLNFVMKSLPPIEKKRYFCRQCFCFCFRSSSFQWSRPWQAKKKRMQRRRNSDNFYFLTSISIASVNANDSATLLWNLGFFNTGQSHLKLCW